MEPAPAHRLCVDGESLIRAGRAHGLDRIDTLAFTADIDLAPHTIPTTYWHALADGRVQCDVCPRACKIREGQRGLCFVRSVQDGGVVLTTYGRSSGFCIDPIEKKPLNHFLPGTPVLSFGTAGCNLACRFCQNWDISKSKEIDTLADAASPETIARTAEQLGCRSVAFTYNDPVIFMEYAIDVADACRERGIHPVAVTAGYICDEPRVEFYRHMDAANVDLKAFTEDFYKHVTVGHLQPVLDTLEYLRHETDVWFEITNLRDPRPQRQRPRVRRDGGVDRGPPRAGRAAALHRLPPRLQDARRPADPAGDAHPGADDRPAQRAPVRLHRQRPRHRRVEHVLPRLWADVDRARLVPARRLPPDRRRALRALRRRRSPDGSRRPRGGGVRGASRSGSTPARGWPSGPAALRGDRPGSPDGRRRLVLPVRSGGAPTYGGGPPRRGGAGLARRRSSAHRRR